MAAFSELGLQPELCKAVEEMGWMLPTDVQAESIPLILGGGDVLMAAETGSGKTGAFCLPLLQIVWETLKEIQTGKHKKIQPIKCEKWQMSFFDRSLSTAITPDGLRCQSRDQKEWNGCRCTKGVCSKGRFYFEAIVEDEGLCRVGWSTQQAVLDLGTDKFGFGFGGTGKKSNNRTFEDYGESFGLKDVIGCLIDLDKGTIGFSKNGRCFGTAFTIPQTLKSVPFFPAVVLKNAEMLFEFGSGSLKYLPEGYNPISKADKCFTVYNNIGNQPNTTVKLPNAPQAIIIEPSKELAEQTKNNINLFKNYLHNPTPEELLIVGGSDVREQISALRSGVDIVVGTPGRMQELMQEGYMSLTQCRFFILDEADSLLQQGHEQLIRRMYSQIPKLTSNDHRLQMIVCSATLHSNDIKKLGDQLMHFPTWVDLKGQDSVPETVHHVVVMVDPQKDTSWKILKKHIQTDRVHAFGSDFHFADTYSEGTKILKGEYVIRAIKNNNITQALIFCRTKLDCDNLQDYLRLHGINAVCLHGDLKLQQRKENLNLFKQKKVNFLICTDVAARGLDINGLPFIINVTLPDEKSNYVHRIGRVGRADHMGLAISLVSTVPEKVWYHSKNCMVSNQRNCTNSRLLDEGGCCIWYNEKNLLSEIEEHLGVTIQQVSTDISIPADDFDGHVVYGTKYASHVEQMSSAVKELAFLEREVQQIYVKRYFA